jgi:hypothetical protein
MPLTDTERRMTLRHEGIIPHTEFLSQADEANLYKSCTMI